MRAFYWRILLGGVLLVAAAVVMVACVSDDDGDSSGPPEAQSYETLEELRDAAIAAGYDCEQWRQTNSQTFAAESGHCSDDSALATFDDQADVQAQLDEMRRVFAEHNLTFDPVLVGPNWTINAPEVAELRQHLGGVIVTK